MRLLYSIFYFTALCFIAPFEYFKRPKEIRGRWIKERCGFIDARQDTAPRTLVWIHAVSVGETIAVTPFVKKIKEKYPETGIVLSTVTDTGRKVAKERLGSVARIIYVPFDLCFAVRGVIKSLDPALLVIMETELWPNMIGEASKSGVPVMLLNGRISEKSFDGYLKLRFFLKKVLGNVGFFCMQNKVYAERMIALGAAPERVVATGNLKFDTPKPASNPEWTAVLKGPVVIGGSTHRTEEELLLDAYAELKQDFQDLNLVLAPRHPERFKEVEELVMKKGFPLTKRSEIKSPYAAASLSGAVVLLDVIGELSGVYGAADIAVMGGSFIPHGGQNPLEPACWGKTIICGPHMENFPFMPDFYEEGAAVEVRKETLSAELRRLLLSPDNMVSTGEKAKTLYERNSGAIEKTLEIIGRYL
ncbi:MAG: 3-deoxy-D-manno-octulosonic acid transferase [Nitrospirae bacterium]|nr:MAG: 3-deoxy-D-manno-octulosonic acid transferase [Nitrospirota bacterium]